MASPERYRVYALLNFVGAPLRPEACKRQTAVRFAKIFSQVTATPAVRPVTVMPVLRTRIRLDGKDEQQNRSGRERLQHRLLHKR